MNNQENALRSGIVRILNGKGETVGTGFLVSEQLILTCAHVIRLTKESIKKAGVSLPSGYTVSLYFLMDEQKRILSQGFQA